MRRAVLAAIALALLAPGAADAGADGGVSSDPSVTGGAAYGEPTVDSEAEARERRAARAKRRARRERRAAPTLETFTVSRTKFFLYGDPATVSFRIKDRSKTVNVALDVIVPTHRGALKRIGLGDRATGVTHTITLTGLEKGGLPSGAFKLRLRARDPGGHSLRQTAHASRVADIQLYGHVFPIAASTYTYGGLEARFGADRGDHVHQGQDLPAPEGTPLVAVRGGVIKHVEYQAGGAGWYVILDGTGEDRDYAYMHLQEGSILVKPDERVRTGQRIGLVGNTGSSEGSHLHFEVWEGGGWYTGGKPVDPLAYLKRWDAWS
jgi:murein DD-endopeptidase MepM/ murein hydrolase activator NlpD